MFLFVTKFLQRKLKTNHFTLGMALFSVNLITFIFINHRKLPDWLWVQCDQCLKWRRLLNEVDSDSLPDLWYCRMNQDATHK